MTRLVGQPNAFHPTSANQRTINRRNVAICRRKWSFTEESPRTSRTSNHSSKPSGDTVKTKTGIFQKNTSTKEYLEPRIRDPRSTNSKPIAGKESSKRWSSTSSTASQEALRTFWNVLIYSIDTAWTLYPSPRASTRPLPSARWCILF